MDVAWDLSGRHCLSVWDSVIAVSQESGRGQRQRTWTSPAGNLYAAWRWPGPESFSVPGWAEISSLLAGYLMADTLIAKGLSVQIKWPNDLLINDRKLGGILLEQKHGQTLVGIGVNIGSRPETHLLRDESVLSATCLKNEGLSARPLALWMDMVGKGKAEFHRIIESMVPEEWTAALNYRLAWIGRRVEVRSGSAAPYEATVRGLAKDGGLELQCGTKTNTIYSGNLVPV